MNDSQKKLIGSLGIALVVLVLFIYFVISPLIGKIKESSQEYLVNREILAQLDQKEFLFNDLGKSYQEKQDQLLMIEGTFLKQEETVGFISDLEKIAKQTGNIFEIKTAQSYIPSDDEIGGTFLSLNISLWGDFNDLLEFLANLEDSPYPPYRLLEIDSLSINRLEDDDFNDGDLETILGIKIYTQ
ncbi:hypothetical protein KKH07_00625 [Patescibacteria group bacterium]|nr:hypothetical protein [Patescibacteria group bacterium]MBU1563597.1 hypothetical protein [Patescibacteria group bacterium]MBU2067991.1 hypothetical protein [Patescibacteria group bacterium]